MIVMTRKTPCYLNLDPNPSNIKLLLPFNAKFAPELICNKYILLCRWLALQCFWGKSGFLSRYARFLQSQSSRHISSMCRRPLIEVSFGVIGGGNTGTFSSPVINGSTKNLNPDDVYLFEIRHAQQLACWRCRESSQKWGWDTNHPQRETYFLYQNCARTFVIRLTIE